MTPADHGSPTSVSFPADALTVIRLFIEAEQKERDLALERIGEVDYLEWLSGATELLEAIRDKGLSRDILIELLRGVVGIPARVWVAFGAVLLFAVLA